MGFHGSGWWSYLSASNEQPQGIPLIMRRLIADVGLQVAAPVL